MGVELEVDGIDITGDLLDDLHAFSTLALEAFTAVGVSHALDVRHTALILTPHSRSAISVRRALGNTLVVPAQKVAGTVAIRTALRLGHASKVLALETGRAIGIADTFSASAINADVIDLVTIAIDTAMLVVLAIGPIGPASRGKNQRGGKDEQ